jgi:thaumarchaeosortase
MEKFTNGSVRERLGKVWFHVAFLVSISLPIIVLMILDWLNIESFYVFNLRFLFPLTWKGRMFYLFFLWLLFLESIIDWDKIVEKKPENSFRIFAFFAAAAVPLVYVLSVNFWGLNKFVTSIGEDLGFTGYNLDFHWPLSAEYIVFTVSFLVAIFLAYKKEGLKFFSIALSLLGGMCIVYMINTYYATEGFKPFDMLALPTSACAAALLDILGYHVTLQYTSGAGSMPLITVSGKSSAAAYIGWPCAGVHSLFLFVVIILLMFKRSNISNYRKFVYFVVGAVGTYFVNILRIASYFTIFINNGEAAADFFHNSLGEFYFIAWVSIYIMMIISIEKYKLVEKARYCVRRLFSILGNVKSKV